MRTFAFNCPLPTLSSLLPTPYSLLPSSPKIALMQDLLALQVRPDVFEVADIPAAMQIILTNEPGITTEERWKKETPYLVEDIGKRLGIGPDTCVLDYGCGIGRIAKGLIDRFGCRVVGVDCATSMRLLAPDYVLSERFTAWSPEVLEKMIEKGFRADAAICLWVIQHVMNAPLVIRQIARSFRPGSLLYALNQFTRCLPTNIGWVNDGLDIRAALCEEFHEESLHQLPESIITPHLAATTMVQVLRSPR